MKSLDFLAVGDMAVDAFIELEDARVTCDINDSNCTISMKFADKIPYKDVTVVHAVGNSPNAAVSAARLGLGSGLVTHAGSDEAGQECLASLTQNGVDTTFVTQESDLKTNYHYVLSYDADRTILIKHQPFTYDFPTETKNLAAPRFMYLSSIGDNTLAYHEQIADYLEANPDIKLAFQPGTFQMKLGHEKLARLYKRTELFFCNKEESQRILGTDESDIKVLLKNMRDIGPTTVFITDGPRGAYAYDGEHFYMVPIYPDPKPPVERTGAGDAFASTITAAIALGKSLPEALLWGPVNSMNVVQYIGAQKGLLTREQLEELLAKAPEDYKVKEI